MILSQALPALLLVLAVLAIVRWCVVGWPYEGKPRLRRVEWRSPGSKWGPAEIRRLGELTDSTSLPDIQGGGLSEDKTSVENACRVTVTEQISIVPAGVSAPGRQPSFADPKGRQ